MKKSIITMIAIVIVAAINLNVYLDDAEAGWLYKRTSTPCLVMQIQTGNTHYDCDLYSQLPPLPGQDDDNSGNNSGSGSSGSEDNTKYDASEVECDIEEQTGDFECYDSFGDVVSCTEDEWTLAEREWETTGSGTYTTCYGGGSDDCEDTDCE